VDYWALGILIFEVLVGVSPFADASGNMDQMTIFRNIMACKPRFPSGYRDKDAKVMIKKILVSNVVNRLGCGHRGATDIKDQAFFAGLDFYQLRTKQMQAPWAPSISDPLDVSNFDNFEEDDYVDPFSGDANMFDDF